jgi:hypothetical protein
VALIQIMIMKVMNSLLQLNEEENLTLAGRLECPLLDLEIVLERD